MNKNLKILGLNIKAERTRKEFSQFELAEKVDASETTISNIERGLQHPSALLVFNISKALDVTLDDLFKGVQ